jgi:hypothetical protein
VEIAVDLDGLLINFWRSIQTRWDDVANYLTGFVSEIDIYAKHEALLAQRDVLNAKLRSDPDWCNPMLAAWWWEGISSWLGSGFGHHHSRQRPHIDRSLKGVWATRMTDEKIKEVAARLASVVLLAGDWEEGWRRSCTPAILNRFHRGVGVFLDPPYSGDRQAGLYVEDAHLNQRITEWALDLPAHVRVVIAGYDHEYPSLLGAGWELVPWKAPKGYANPKMRKDGNERRHTEALYVRPSGTPPVPTPSRRTVRRPRQLADGDDHGRRQDGDGDHGRASAAPVAPRRPWVRIRPQERQVPVGEGDRQVGPPGQRPGHRR